MPARDEDLPGTLVKHVAEKKGDRWELKGEPGPSDEQAARSGRLPASE
jgi:hypothetical protein